MTATDTPQQKLALRTNPTARKVRALFPEGTRVMGVPAVYGTVQRHVPGLNALGGYLVVKWDTGTTGRVSVPGLTIVNDPCEQCGHEYHKAEEGRKCGTWAQGPSSKRSRKCGCPE